MKQKSTSGILIKQESDSTEDAYYYLDHNQEYNIEPRSANNDKFSLASDEEFTLPVIGAQSKKSSSRGKHFSNLSNNGHDQM